MQQLIYHGGDPTSRKQKVLADFPVKENFHLHLPASPDSLKIKDVRELLAQLTTTSQRARLVWIEEAQTLTLPAQHALLKSLEEPPDNTTFVLSLPRKELLLATIISRCQLISLPPATPASTDLNKLTVFKQALSAKPGTRLQLAHSLGKKRPEVLTELETVVQSLHALLQKETNPRSLYLLATLLELILNAIEELDSNTNVQLSLENLFLSLPRTS